MGNVQQQTEDFSAQYKDIRKEEDYQIIEHKETNIRYMLKEFGYGDKKEYEKQLQKYNNLLKENQNESILNVVKVHSQQFNNLCASTFKIYVIYEFPSVTLQEEIVARKKQDKYFDECQLWAILQSCINGLEEVKPTISLQPSLVFIVPDGLLKIINNDMIKEDFRCLVNEKYYYAPEKMNKFNQLQTKETLKKQMIFSLGMTLLHTSLLEPVKDCYNFQKMEYIQGQLQNYLEAIIEKYSDEFIEVLVWMLEPEPEKRASLQDIKNHLNKVWNGETQEQENKEQEPIYEQQQQKMFQQSHYQQETEQDKYLLVENSINRREPEQLPIQDQVYTNSYKMSSNLCSQVQSKMEFVNPNQYQYQNQNQYQQSLSDKENLFTDPKLLEMIRNDLQNIRELKTTTFSAAQNSNRTSLHNNQIESHLNSRTQLH